jgi:hypothetical protein
MLAFAAELRQHAADCLRAGDRSRYERYSRRADAIEKAASDLLPSESALHTVNRKSTVNSVETLSDQHRVSLSASRHSKDPFVKHLQKVSTKAAPHGYTLRSLADALDISPAALRSHRLPKSKANSRPIPAARAERVKDLTGWPSDPGHWPAGVS